MNTLPTAVLLAVLAATAPAQISSVSGDFTPDIASPGTSVTFSITNNTSQSWVTGACDWFRIYAADPATGLPDLSEPIEHTMVCDLHLIATFPGGGLAWLWDQMDYCPGCGTTPTAPFPTPTPVPPGLYWFHATPSGNDAWFSFTIQSSPSEPSLVSITPTATGQTANYVVSSAAHAGAPFATLMSFSANNPIGYVAALGITIPLAPPLFSFGASGTLDGVGNGLVTFQVPAVPALSGEGVHLQSLILMPSLALHATNVLTVTVD